VTPVKQKNWRTGREQFAVNLVNPRRNVVGVLSSSWDVASTKNLLFDLYNNIIIAELVLFALLLMVWAVWAIRRRIKASL
jgi:hypothetical protein